MYMCFPGSLVFSPSFSLPHDQRMPFNNRFCIANEWNICELYFLPMQHSFHVGSFYIMFPFSTSKLEIVPSMWYLDFFFVACKTIGIHGHSWTFKYTHQTKSNVDPYLYYYPSSDHITTQSSVVCKLSHGSYHQLCRSDSPSI